MFKLAESPEAEAGAMPALLDNAPLAVTRCVAAASLALRWRATRPGCQSFIASHSKVLASSKTLSHSLLSDNTFSFLEVLILIIIYIPKSNILDADSVLGQRLFYHLFSTQMACGTIFIWLASPKKGHFHQH